MNTVILMAGGGAQQGAGGGMQQFFLLGMIMVVFWLFMIRPQSKKAKEHKLFIDNLQKGDKIVTTAGIHATVNKVNEDGTLQIEVSPGSYLKLEKSAISQEWTAAINKPATETK
jgi:preprotein translocase subunit YajC